MNYQEGLKVVAKNMAQRIRDMKQADLLERTAEDEGEKYSDEEYILFALEEVSENDGVNVEVEDPKEKVYIHTPNTKGNISTDLDEYGKELANKTLNHFIRNKDDEPFDGDETEYLSKRFLYHLDGLMGNR